MTKRRPDPKNDPVPRAPGKPPQNETDAYESLLEQVEASANDQMNDLLREIDSAATLFSELLAQAEPERAGRIRTEVRFHALKLCELLQEKSREAWYSDPATAFELARLAVEVAERLDPAHYGEALVEDTRALAWAHLGNAYRIASDLRHAEEALSRAEEHRQRGEDELTGAQILSFQASLRISQNRFEEAAVLLDRALLVYRAARDRHLEGRTLIKKGTAFGHVGRTQEAVSLIRRGLSRINLLEEPGLLVTARHNLIWYLNESGHHREALRALESTRTLYRSLGQPTHRVRLRWLEGRILRDLDRLDEAEAALREARSGFVERGIGFDAARVSLDLATVLLKRGQAAELKRLAAEMVPVFESRDVHEEAIAALLLFQRAAEAEEVTMGLLERISAYLQRACHNPELQYRGEA